jgi:hypothetical protein
MAKKCSGLTDEEREEGRRLRDEIRQKSLETGVPLNEKILAALLKADSREREMEEEERKLAEEATRVQAKEAKKARKLVVKVTKAAAAEEAVKKAAEEVVKVIALMQTQEEARIKAEAVSKAEAKVNAQKALLEKAKNRLELAQVRIKAEEAQKIADENLKMLDVERIKVAIEALEARKISPNKPQSPKEIKNAKAALRHAMFCDKDLQDQHMSVYEAAQGGDSEMLQRLLVKKANANFRDNNDLPPLTAAAYQGHIACVKVLVKAGAYIDGVREDDKITALMAAIHNDNIALAEILIGLNASVNLQDSEGDTALHVAMANGSVGAVKLLLASGARIDIKSNECGQKGCPLGAGGHNALQMARAHPNLEIQQAILSCHAKIVAAKKAQKIEVRVKVSKPGDSDEVLSTLPPNFKVL